MKAYTPPTVVYLNAAERRAVSDLMNEVLAATAEWSIPGPFYLEYRNTTVMFAPDTHFYFEIPDAPLPSLGGEVAGDLILAGASTANDRLPSSSCEDFLP
jgi:hypothetical protein